MPVYYPATSNMGGDGFGGRGFYWDQRPEGQAYNAKISQQHGSHFLKAGIEHRRGYGVTFVGNTSNFYFPTELTAEHLQQPGHEAQRQRLCHVPAGCAGRLLADDRRSGAGSRTSVTGACTSRTTGR